MRSHIGWRGERNILSKGVGISLKQTCFKNFEEKPERKNLKSTIFAESDEFIKESI